MAVECWTPTPAWITDSAGAADGHGDGFLYAPVPGSRLKAETTSLIHLVGGNAAAMARPEPGLHAIRSIVHQAGPAGAGATLKLTSIGSNSMARMGTGGGGATRYRRSLTRGHEDIALPSRTALLQGLGKSHLAGADSRRHLRSLECVQARRVPPTSATRSH
ncbi:hypothetical protein [Falsiroseomonas sp.]|uniref:hypothetical protein n=1 Tax=Falsiroseomonas sp. TaxID=2870721 RepID=UPI0038D06C32